MKRFFSVLCILIFCTSLFAQDQKDIAGKWKTMDDKTGELKSIVEISKSLDEKYNGKIIHLYNKPKNNNCIKCTGDLRNKPLIGLEIISNIRKEGNEYLHGTITDPTSGKSYKCRIIRQGNKLEVRGYMGIVSLGRSQVWQVMQ